MTNVIGNRHGRRSRRLSSEEVGRIQRLVKNGLSLRSVAIRTGISYSTVHSYAAQFSKKQSLLNMSLLTERERGYLVGLFVGDGSRIVEEKSGHYGAKFSFDKNRDTEIVSFVRELFERSKKRVTLYNTRTLVTVKIYSKPFLAFLSAFVVYTSCEGRVRKTLVGVHTWPRNFILGFLGGLIDADGHVYEGKRRSCHSGASITMGNPILAEQLSILLDILRLKPTVRKMAVYPSSFSKTPAYRIWFSKAEFSKVCTELICIKHGQCICETKHF